MVPGAIGDSDRWYLTPEVTVPGVLACCLLVFVLLPRIDRTPRDVVQSIGKAV